MTNAQAAANARAPYAAKILAQEREILALRALAKALGASEAALAATRDKPAGEAS